MDELLELKQYIEAERYDDALLLISEMEEIAKEIRQFLCRPK